MRPLAHAIPGAVMAILTTAPLSDGKVTFAWRAAVGPGLERVTSVKLEGHVLLVDTAGALWSREIVRSSAMILTRLEAMLGRGIVESIEVRRA
jgi:Dna[CI] antecedent DciA-like protein